MFKQLKLWLAKLLVKDDLKELEERRKNAQVLIESFKDFEDLIFVTKCLERYYLKNVDFLFEVYVHSELLLENQTYTFDAMRRYLNNRTHDKGQLVNEIKRLRRALAMIAEPIGCLRVESRMDNCPFNLTEAKAKADDPHFYQGIASHALQSDYLKLRVIK